MCQGYAYWVVTSEAVPGGEKDFTKIVDIQVTKQPTWKQ